LFAFSRIANSRKGNSRKGACHVGAELLDSSDPLASASQVSGITGICHQAWLLEFGIN
jgi:hypothetical protein